jgi:hypothetical protein
MKEIPSSPFREYAYAVNAALEAGNNSYEFYQAYNVILELAKIDPNFVPYRKEFAFSNPCREDGYLEGVWPHQLGSENRTLKWIYNPFWRGIDSCIFCFSFNKYDQPQWLVRLSIVGGYKLSRLAAIGNNELYLADEDLERSPRAFIRVVDPTRGEPIRILSPVFDKVNPCKTKIDEIQMIGSVLVIQRDRTVIGIDPISGLKHFELENVVYFVGLDDRLICSMYHQIEGSQIMGFNLNSKTIAWTYPLGEAIDCIKMELSEDKNQLTAEIRDFEFQWSFLVLDPKTGLRLRNIRTPN